MDIQSLTAVRLGEKIKKKELSAVEAAQAAFAQIAACEK